MNVKGKNIIITGGSLGIGKETAKSLVEKGANVLITGRSEKRLLEARFLSMLPKNIKDKKLEKKYKDIMSASGKAPEIMPGGTEGAIGETTSA